MADVGAFASWIRSPLAELMAGRGVAELAAKAGFDATELALSTVRHDPRRRHVVLRGESLRRLDWSARTRRWCAACFADDIDEARAGGLDDDDLVNHRAWWDVLPLAMCPRHSIALSVRCAICGTKPAWGTAPLHRCVCGADLSRREVGNSAIGACDRFIHDRMTGKSDHPDLLRTAPLSSAIPILHWLGRSATGTWNGRWPEIGDRRSLSNELLEAGMRIACDWPDAFVEVLDRGLRSSGRTSSGMLASYGWVHEQFVSRLEPSETGTAIRTVLRDHAIANGVVARSEAVLGFPPSAGTVGLTEACSLLGSGFASARRTLTAQRHVPRGSRRGVRHAIDRRALLALAGRRQGRIDLNGLGSMLHLGRGAVRTVVASGLLDPADRTEPGELARSFDEAAVRRLVVGLATRVETLDEGDETIDLVAAARYSGSSVAAILEQVRSGALTPARWSSDGSLREVRFRRGHLPRLPRVVAGFDLSTVARRTGIHPEAIRALAVSGLLKGHRTASTWLFTQSDLDAFQRSYVSGAEIAATLATSPRSAIARLIAAGVHPVIGPPSCRQTIFSRSAIASARRSFETRSEFGWLEARPGTRRRAVEGSKSTATGR